MWAAGHFLVFIAGTRFLVGTLLMSSAALRHWYTVAYLGAIVSYGVVVYKSFGVRWAGSFFRAEDCAETEHG